MEAASTTTTVYGPSEEAELVTTRQERDRPAVPVRAIEAIGIFVLFAVAYGLLGAKVVGDQHVVVFDALDRLTRAFMVWHNDPPKLAAIGFSVAPIATVALLPLAAFTGLVTSGLALPITSAVFAGAALTAFNLMFAAADMGRLRALGARPRHRTQPDVRLLRRQRRRRHDLHGVPRVWSSSRSSPGEGEALRAT